MTSFRTTLQTMQCFDLTLVKIQGLFLKITAEQIRQLATSGVFLQIRLFFSSSLSSHGASAVIQF